MIDVGRRGGSKVWFKIYDDDIGLPQPPVHTGPDDDIGLPQPPVHTGPTQL